MLTDDKMCNHVIVHVVPLPQCWPIFPLSHFTLFFALMPSRTHARTVLPEVEASFPRGASFTVDEDDFAHNTSDRSFQGFDNELPAHEDSEESGGPSRVPLAEATTAAENVPNIILHSPSEDQGGSILLLTPSHPR